MIRTPSNGPDPWAKRRRAALCGVLLLCLVGVVFVGARNWMSRRGGTGSRASRVPPVFRLEERVAAHPGLTLVGPPRDQTLPPGDVRGIVVNETRAPIRGAYVALLRREADSAELPEFVLCRRRFGLTGDDGRFELSRASLEATGELVVLARHPRYCSAFVTVAPDALAPLEIVLRSGKSIAGIVVLGDGGPPVQRVRLVARGIGASVACARADVFPGAGASCQTCASDDDGRFLFEGLSEGEYFIEIVEEGLIVAPFSWIRAWREETVENSMPHAFHRERSVIAPASSRELVITLLPLAVAAIRAVDRVTGLPVLHATIHLAPEEWFSTPPHEVRGDGRVLVTNGRSIDLSPAAVAPGAHVELLVPHAWPMEGEKQATLRVSAEGYGPVEVKIVPAPATAELAYAEVALEPIKPTGGIELSLVDSSGFPVSGASIPVTLSPAGGESDQTPPPTRGARLIKDCFALNMRIGPGGESAYAAVPCGRYRIESGSMFAARVAPIELEVNASATARGVLRLVGGAIRIQPIDERSLPLGDVGLRLGSAGAPVQTRYEFSVATGTLTISGLFLRIPGLGDSEPLLLTGMKAGSYRIEAYRPGYEPAWRDFEVRADGQVQELRIVMRASPGCRWDTFSRDSPVMAGDPMPTRRVERWKYGARTKPPEMYR
ncbi:MAG: hypothetical protein ACT4PV_11675 [Planctomycetaceae bacterium]